MTSARIVVVEDEPVIALDIQRRLTRLGYKVVAIAENAKTALEHVAQLQPDLILMDIRLRGESSGIEAAAQIQEQFHLPVIFLTAHTDEITLEQAKATRPFGYVIKPFETHDLSIAIELALSRHQAETAIRNHAQKQLDDLRSSIALSLPHEFRTPLTAILSGVELLRARPDLLKPTKILELTEPILNSTNRLCKLVQNFLLYAELEITARDPEWLHELLGCETHNSKLCITDTATQIARQVERETDLQLDLQNVTVPIASDNLKKIVEELTDNAFKFSDAGTSVHIVSVADETTFMLEVIDQGRGMTAEQIGELGAYMQFERKRHEQQGSGLGLAIVKRLLELHGGKLAIDSIIGIQTSVRATVPLKHAPL
jgi:two-component system, sensor histidine kinase and response regulator